MPEFGDGPKLSAEDARHEAERWTDYLIDAYLRRPSEDRPRLGQPESAFALRDVEDLQLGIVRFGTQLRQLSQYNLRTPALAYTKEGIVIPVDIASVTDEPMPSQPDQVEHWAARAEDTLTSISDRSTFVYEELDADDAVALVRSELTDSLTKRFMAARFFGGTTRITTFEISVHVRTPDLRVHHSSPAPFNPIFFGAPTPTVKGRLEGGRYRFGDDGPKMTMTPDPGIFDIPETTEIFLIVA